MRPRGLKPAQVRALRSAKAPLFHGTIRTSELKQGESEFVRELKRESHHHEEEHYPAGILGVSPVVAAAEHRKFAPARRHHVRRGDCDLLWRGERGPHLVRSLHAFS